MVGFDSFLEEWAGKTNMSVCYCYATIKPGILIYWANRFTSVLQISETIYNRTSYQYFFKSAKTECAASNGETNQNQPVQFSLLSYIGQLNNVANDTTVRLQKS